MKRTILCSSLLLLSALFFATSCSKESSPVIISDAAVVLTIDSKALITDGGGDEVFAKMFGRDKNSLEIYNAIDKSAPITVAFSANNGASVEFTASTAQDAQKLVEQLSNGEKLEDLGTVAGYNVKATVDSFSKLFFLANDKEVVMLSAMNISKFKDAGEGLALADAIAGGSLEATLNGSAELKHFSRAEVAGIYKNDIGYIVSAEGLAMIEELRMSLASYATAGTIYYGGLNFNAGEIVLDFNAKNQVTPVKAQKVSSALFKFIPKAYSNILMAISIDTSGDIEKVITEAISTTAQQQSIRAEKQAEVTTTAIDWVKSLKGEIIGGGMPTTSGFDFSVAASVDTALFKANFNKYIEELTPIKDQPDSYYFRVNRSSKVYFKFSASEVLITNLEGNTQSLPTESIEGTEGAEFTEGALGGAIFVDIDGTIEALPSEMRSFTAFIPVIDKLDNLEVKKTSETYGYFKVTFKDKETNALKVLVDELGAML